MNRRLALVIANSHYRDRALPRLKSPPGDAAALDNVLGSPRLGGFQVKVLEDPSLLDAHKHISMLFHDRDPDDLLLLYLSGHGLRDAVGRLYLPVAETELELLSATALPAAFITEEMDLSNSRKKVLILDCCNSGAVIEGAKDGLSQSLGAEQVFHGNGTGRAILTATDATHYAWERDRFEGTAPRSRFTHFLVEGIETGAAKGDPDGDYISLFEAFRYAENRVLEGGRGQRPRFWPSGLDDLEISRSVLSADIAQALREDGELEDVKRRAQDATKRLQQVAALEVRLADEADRDWVLNALRVLADDEDPSVATTAAATLAGFYRDLGENLMKRGDFEAARSRFQLALEQLPTGAPQLRTLRGELGSLLRRCDRPWRWLPQVRRKTRYKKRGVLPVIRYVPGHGGVRQGRANRTPRPLLKSFGSRAFIVLPACLALGILVSYAGGKAYWSNTFLPDAVPPRPPLPGDTLIRTAEGVERLDLRASGDRDLTIQRDASVTAPSIGQVPAGASGILWWGNCRSDGERVWFRVRYRKETGWIEGWVNAADLRARSTFRLRIPDTRLSVRAAPGDHNHETAALPPGARGVVWLGGCRLVQTSKGLSAWFEVGKGDLRGWVNSIYLEVD